MAPERLLKASVLMALYSVRSERLFCEQLGYNMLFKWFLDMNMLDEPFDFSVNGTLTEAWGSTKSFRPKEGDTPDNKGFVDFRG